MAGHHKKKTGKKKKKKLNNSRDTTKTQSVISHLRKSRDDQRQRHEKT